MRIGRLLAAGMLWASAQTAAVAPLRADLAVLTTGSYLKIDRYELQGDRMRLHLRSGGSLSLAIERIERIVDDEVEPEPEVVPEEPAPGFVLTFEPAQTVPSTPYGELLYRAAREHELNPALLAAVARAESAFDARALSRKGARGLLQIMPATGLRFGVDPRDLWEPEKNAAVGARYLRFLADRFDGDLARILAAYNAGEGAVERYAGVPPYRETRRYVAKILTLLGVEAP